MCAIMTLYKPFLDYIIMLPVADRFAMRQCHTARSAYKMIGQKCCRLFFLIHISRPFFYLRVFILFKSLNFILQPYWDDYYFTNIQFYMLFYLLDTSVKNEDIE
jgi:hypothetical protein